jgi:hypothetical protein
MNAGSIKVKILIIQLIDWVLLLGVFGMGIYAVLYSDDPTKYGLIALAGLWLLHMLGQYSVTKLTRLRMELSKIEKNSR